MSATAAVAPATPEIDRKPPEETSRAPDVRATALRSIPIEELEKTDGTNIRADLDTEGLQDLAASVKVHGILEPVLVRPSKDGYVLVAGFRRVAAAKIAGLKEVPARILVIGTEDAAEIQLVENLQRVDLSPMEEARAYKAYREQTGVTQEQLARRIGKSQPYVANRERLLGLPSSAIKLVDSGKLSGSQAEILLKAPAEARPVVEELAKAAATRGMSTRDLDHELSWRSKEHLKELAKKKRIAEAKFPKCPTCSKPATDEDYNGFLGHGGDTGWRAEHRWRGGTGETLKRINDKDAAAARKRSRASPGAQPPAPKRDLSQPATTRATAHPHAIARRILELLGPDGVAEIVLEEDDRTSNVKIRLTEKAAKELPFCPSTLRIRPQTYSTGEVAQVAVLEKSWEGFDAKVRKAGLAAFDSWARKALPAGKAKPERAADPKLLEGNVTEVLNRLEAGKQGKRPCDDTELIEQLRVLEGRGANRPSILERFDEWLEIDEE